MKYEILPNCLMPNYIIIQGRGRGGRGEGEGEGEGTGGEQCVVFGVLGQRPGSAFPLSAEHQSAGAALSTGHRS
jgi:hypothetical protein